MITKEGLIEAFGGPFTTRQKVTDALGYKSYKVVDALLDGLDRFGTRYWSEDIAERVLERVERYEKEDC